MKVPFLDIPAQNQAIWSELQEALEPVMSGAQFILGPAVERFENGFASYIGTAHCVGLNSGTSALHMALHACDIGPGDEVITTPHTWISTSWAISYMGAVPVFVDIDSRTYNIDVNRVEEAITPRTKAILPVHLYGQACDVVRLHQICETHGLTLIEDAAQAHGAMIGDRRAGSIGTAGCFSFYPGKNLGAFGEGGAVVTNDRQIADRIRRLRDHAQDGRHNHVELGYNTRMEGIQAAVLDVKLRYLDDWNASRRGHAANYARRLADMAELKLPQTEDQRAHVWHLYVVLLPHDARDEIREQMAARGIAAAVHYPTPVPFQPAYAHLGHKPGDFAIAENSMKRCLSLPLFPELKSEQIEYVCTTLRKLLASRRVRTV